MSNGGQLTLDEELFLQATKTLADMESEGLVFGLADACRKYTREPYLPARYAAETGDELAADVRDAIGDYAMSVFLVYHHRNNLEDLGAMLEEYEGSADLEFIRAGAWALLTAWTQRYGGLHSRLVTNRGGVDPSLGDPPK